LQVGDRVRVAETLRNDMIPVGTVGVIVARTDTGLCPRWSVEFPHPTPGQEPHRVGFPMSGPFPFVAVPDVDPDADQPQRFDPAHDGATYLGRWFAFDLFHIAAGVASVAAYYGHEPGDYTSGFDMKLTPALVEAQARAKARGLRIGAEPYPATEAGATCPRCGEVVADLGEPGGRAFLCCGCGMSYATR
jgi:hypothetical protein